MEPWCTNSFYSSSKCIRWPTNQAGPANVLLKNYISIPESLVLIRLNYFLCELMERKIKSITPESL